MADPSSWHTQSVEAVVSALGSRVTGLTSKQVAERQVTHGPNELTAQHTTSAWRLLAAQFKNTLILILLAATALSVVLGHGVESLVIAVIVLFAALLGFVQEFRAEKAIESLKRMAAPGASVLRDGVESRVPARELVPGDVVRLHTGDRVPADARVIEAINLQADEAALTGESNAVAKLTRTLEGTLAVGDRHNLVFAGTVITAGRGTAMVVATGMSTEFGRIARLLETIETSRTPLQKNLDRVGAQLGRAALGLVALVVALGLVRGQPFVELLLFGVALAVAVVPEALPAVVTISLALGVQRLVKRNALVRRLPAVETLGSTTVICTDKTGTLTQDQMTVRRVFAATERWDVSGTGYAPKGEFSKDGQTLVASATVRALLEAGVLASDASLVQTDGQWSVKGDPTEGAVVVAAAKLGLERPALDALFPRIAETPFSSETKRMATLHQGPVGPVVHVKGAPEVVLSACTHLATSQGVEVLTDSSRAALTQVAADFAHDALRVLAVATRANATLAEAEGGLTLLGLVGMADPPRPEAFEALRTCEAAGIRAMMLTGDHPHTAEAVARELKLLKHGRVVIGAELDGWHDSQLAAEVDHIDVFARVSPAHKLRIVAALRTRGHVVAMTGDGVNDAPALRQADIGIAMGRTGTDVSRDAAAMTLLDDSFGTIVAAVEEGRRIFDNVTKYLMYLLSSNIGEIGLMAGTGLLGLPLPLTTAQLLYVNLATDGLPALALAVDPKDDDVMQRAPKVASAGIFTGPVVGLMVVGGVWSSLINAGLFWWESTSGRSLERSRTMAFVALVLVQFFKAYAYRSLRRSTFHRPFANRWLNLAMAWELGLLALVLFVPAVERLFAVVPLSAVDWAVVLVASATVVPVLEIGKYAVRRGWFGQG